jgi:hypothetical protein
MNGAYPGRVRDPQPIGRAGETALVVLAAVVLAVALAALAGLGLASLVAGRGWVWPHGADTAGHVLGGILTGRPGHGLPARTAARVASDPAVYTGIAVCEVLLGAVTGLGWWLAAGWYRPSDARRGMATRSEAAAVLGAARLRSARAVIRPDLAHASRRRWRPW